MAAQPKGLELVGEALKALTYDEMMEAATIFLTLLQDNKGPIVKPETMANTLNDFLEAVSE